MSPTIRFLSPVPIVAWLPFVILAVGSDEAFKVGLVALASFFILYAHAYHAARGLPAEYLELCDLYEKPLLARIRHIVFPACARHVLTGLRLSLAIGWIVVFFVEYSAAREGSQGLGWFIADARNIGRVEDEYAAVLLLALLGLLLDAAVSFAARRLLIWDSDPAPSISATAL